ncbi:hypothetical protein G6F40_016010 [Rhizopus arrhizus]|nr:hypothetical protein G6F40_016010 [Rhizopus arrhizus]
MMRLNGRCASAATGASHCAWPSRASAAICFRRAMRASHGERSNTVSAASSMQQGAGIAAAGTAAGQLAIGVAGDVEEACVIHVAAHAVHCRHAFRAGATAAERDQQGRAVALQVQRRVGQQAGARAGGDR